MSGANLSSPNTPSWRAQLKKRWRPDIEIGYKYIEKPVADNREGVVLQLGGCAGG